MSTLSQYQTSLCIAASLLAVVCGWSSSSVAKERYNVWAKEKIRVHRDRVNQFPNNAELRVVLGTAYYEDGNLREAEVHLKRAIEIKSDYPEAHCNLGIVYQAWAHRSEAERHYREALRQDSTLIEAMAGLGTLLCASNRHAQGIQHLEGVLRLDARRDDARFNLGVAYHKVGDHIRAIEHLGDLLKRRQDYPGARHGLAQAHLARGLMYLQAELLQPALDQFQFSLRQVSTANAHYARGLAFLQLEDLEHAETEFASAVEMQNDHVPALHNLAVVYEETGRLKEAEDYYLRVEELTPHLSTIDAARNAEYDEKVLLK